MEKAIGIEDFLDAAQTLPLIDVRSPGEFANGHIPTAVNIPLFSDSERASVGTTYKEHGRQRAVLEGLEFVGPKLRTLAESARALAGQSQHVLVHCWRGGMRSDSVAWLLRSCGLHVTVLSGGYKSWRRRALELFEWPWKLRILGGKTGSGKTAILGDLTALGEQVIDLEALARHKGSAFGALGEQPAPSQEQFENELAWRMRQCDSDQQLWFEDESRRIGQRCVPDTLWQRMKASPLIFLDLPLAPRLERLLRDYGDFAAEELKQCIRKIERRLGGVQTQQALRALDEGNVREAVRIALHYYDKTYLFSLGRRSPDTTLRLEQDDYHAGVTARTLLQLSHTIKSTI